jgi:alanyl-tRNA synthetase
VLRRIMRRAMRHAQLLGVRKDPLMYRLVPRWWREMGQAYPELAARRGLITETLKLEETRFRKTLERGLSLLDEASADLSKGDRLDGETAFKLYDTYGFPLDLTQDALRQRGVDVDTEGFPRPWNGRRPRRASTGRARVMRRRKRSGSRSRTRPAPPISSAMTPRPPRA